MQTGEDTQGLRKIIDFTRLISIFILAIHGYLSCYMAFEVWGLTAEITDRIISSIAKTGLYQKVGEKVERLLQLISKLAERWLQE